MNKNMKSKRNRFRTLLASCLIVCADYTYGNPGDFTALQNAINEAQEYIASHASSYTGAIVALYQDEVNIAQDLAKRMALRHAGIAPEDIQYLNAHGTSTNVGDVNEVKAIKEVFGEHAGKLVVNSTKSMTGHLLGGAGGVESVFTIKALEEQVSPPTINVFEQDPECDIDCCPNEARRMEINYAMKNSFGFGGTNSTVIYKRWTE